MGQEGTLVPARFLTMMGHLLATIMFLYCRALNIFAALGPKVTKLTAPEFTDVSGTLDIVIYAALACFAVELLGLFSGLTMFKPGLSLLYIVAHFCGCVFTAFLTMETWHYAWFYYIFGACSAFPAGLEVLTMLAIATKKHT